MSVYPAIKLLINGEWKSEAGRESEPVIDPATGAAIGAVPHATTADLDEALASADRAFAGWRSTPPARRSEILRTAATLLTERAEDIALWMSLEQGKPLAEARSELAVSAAVFNWSAEEAWRTYGKVLPQTAPGQRRLVTLEPVGVALAFTPWNFPALTVARKVAAALAAGCTVVLKPSEETPATAMAIAAALQDAGLPRGALNLVFGDPPTLSAHLVSSPLVRKLSFTGSVNVGKQLMRLAAGNLLRTTMELGGHAPVLVFGDADIDAVAAACAAAKFRNAGQVCVSPTRFFVDEAVHDRFVERFVAAAKQLRVGPGTHAETTMGPLTNARRIDAMEAFVSDSQMRGGQIRTGGERIGNAGFFYYPTLVTDLPDDARLMTEEPFGPIAPIVRFAGLDEVIARANALRFGLSAYAFTNDSRIAAAVSDGLKAGMVGINTFAVSTPESPFGGVRDSGHGQEGGPDALLPYLEAKYIVQV